MLYCTILYCALLYYTVLFYVILCYKDPEFIETANSPRPSAAEVRRSRDSAAGKSSWALGFGFPVFMASPSKGCLRRPRQVRKSLFLGFGFGESSSYSCGSYRGLSLLSSGHYRAEYGLFWWLIGDANWTD